MKEATRERDAPFVMALTHHSNSLVAWTQTLILSGTTPKSRLRRFEKLARIARQCYQFNNLSSAMSIVGGLKAAPIMRLRNSLSALSSSAQLAVQEIDKLFDPDYLRDLLKRLSPPCVPPLPLFLKDIFRIEENFSMALAKSKQATMNGPVRVDFTNRLQLLEAIKLIQSFQQTASYGFSPLPWFQVELAGLAAHVKSDDDLWALSFACEP